MKRLLFLTLCLCVLLMGCGQKTTEVTEHDSPEECEAIEPPQPVADYQWGGYVNIFMPMPYGWEWEATEMSDGDGEPPVYVGFNFWNTEEPDLRFTFECWPQGFGMCGTGVKFTEINGKHDLTLAEEQGIGVVAVTIIFNDVPGSYVIGGSIPNDLWEKYRNDVVQMVDEATVAEGCLTQEEAVNAIRAENNWPDENCKVYGNYDASEGVWNLRFEDKLPGGEEITAYARVDNCGEVLQLSQNVEGNDPLAWN